MRATLQRAFIQANPGEDPLHSLDVARLTRMRRGHDRQFFVGEPEVVGAARLDQWQKLERLGGRSEIGDPVGIAYMCDQIAVRIDYSHRAKMDGLDAVTACDFDQRLDGRMFIQLVS